MAIANQSERSFNILDIISNRTEISGLIFFFLLYQIFFDLGQKFKFAIAHSPQIANAVVEPYNNVLHMHTSMRYSDCCFLFDNEALYDICYQSLAIEKPSYESINRLIAQVRTQSKINSL